MVAKRGLTAHVSERGLSGTLRRFCLQWRRIMVACPTAELPVASACSMSALARKAAGLAVAMCLAGCVDAPSSRQMAVTLMDVPEIECVGVSLSAALEAETMEELAKERERLCEDEHVFSPPTPEGRIMRVNETDKEMRAWFDPHPGAESVVDAERYDSPLVVYVGEFHDDYIEGVYTDVFNTDELDEEAGRMLCGDRVRAHGVLSLTHAKGILGRIRWEHHVYVESVTSSCAGRIDCVRDIAVDGLELD